jgi:O-antigen biosynthesis protein
MGIEEELLARLAEKDKWIDQLVESLAESEFQVSDLEQKVQALESLIHEVTGSASFAVARRLAHAARVIAPKGTRRRWVMHRGLRAARAVAKLRDRQRIVHHARSLVIGARSTLRRLLDSCRIESGRLAGQKLYPRLSPDSIPRFPVHDSVDVSIIIPVFNHWQSTLACLESIAQLTAGSTYEVVVVDDGSSDETCGVLEQIEGLVALRNNRNLGFIGSCNRGAATARGKFLVFLNNDTVVTPGWLDALVRTFRSVPGTGLAGAKLLYPDGRLQEAGSVIWHDGTGWNYGKFDDAGHPRYNFTREVDYCSGACIMVPKSLFWEFGGFDSQFTPAYYEDTDLAFKIRNAGHKVIYQPHAKIIHHEGLTSGTSLESGVKSYQRVNQTKFQERWRQSLESHSPPPPPDFDRNDYTRIAEFASRRQVLVIDHRLPSPDRDSGSVRMMELIRAIRHRGHHVVFVPDDLNAWPGYLEDLQFIGVEVIHTPYFGSVAEYLRQHGPEIDLAIISRRDIAAKHMTSVRRFAPQAKIVFDTVDLHFLRCERQALLEQGESQNHSLAISKQQEHRLAMRADMTLVVSPIEKAILERECPGIDVRILSNIHQLEEIKMPGFDGRSGLIFIGGFQHPPNADAVLYFVREILPRIRSRLPDVLFQVIGPDAPPEVVQLASPNIEVLGYVPDVKPMFHRARVSVAPLRFGAGVKGKVNQSMALGLPTVVTTIAAEGMYLVHEHNAMIADDADGFADAVVRLHTSRELWQRLSAQGLECVKEHFSVEAASKPIDELLEWAGLTRSDQSRSAHSLTVSSFR